MDALAGNLLRDELDWSSFQSQGVGQADPTAAFQAVSLADDSHSVATVTVTTAQLAGAGTVSVGEPGTSVPMGRLTHSIMDSVLSHGFAPGSGHFPGSSSFQNSNSHGLSNRLAEVLSNGRPQGVGLHLNKEVHRRPQTLQIPEPKTDLHRKIPLPRKEICIVCLNRKYLDAMECLLQTITEEIKEAQSDSHKIPINKMLLQSADHDDLGDFMSSRLVLLVSVSQFRQIIISEVEGGELGRVYKESQRLHRNVFLALVAHDESQSLENDRLYAASLNNLLRSQERIGELASQEKFISIGKTSAASRLQINRSQREAIRNWIVNGLFMGEPSTVS